MALPIPPSMTETEYLDFERQQTDKHEYFGGRIFAMSGANRAHNIITGNVYAALHAQLRGRDCEIYPSDMRVHNLLTHSYTYPDVTIVCETPQFLDDALDTLLNPTLIIEVLSNTTQHYDRTEKFRAYRQLTSLQAYVLIAQSKAHIEYYRRDGDEWCLADVIGLESEIALTEINALIKLKEVYERLDI
jgi:Uma2 family endonuclease